MSCSIPLHVLQGSEDCFPCYASAYLYPAGVPGDCYLTHNLRGDTTMQHRSCVYPADTDMDRKSWLMPAHNLDA